MTNTFGPRRHRWAIDTNDGTLFAFKGTTDPTFATRTEARLLLPKVRQFFRDAAIVKVQVKYEVVG